VKTSTWIITLLAGLAIPIATIVWTQNNSETALVSNPDVTTIEYNNNSSVTPEEKPDSKALNPKYQTLWNDFERLGTDELMRDHEAMSNPTRNIPVCELDQSKLSDAGKDRVYLLTVGYICRHPKGGYGYAVEPSFMARRAQDIEVNQGFSVTPDTPLEEVKKQIGIYLKTNRNTDVDSVKKPK
jgi:hypothetical protein